MQDVQLPTSARWRLPEPQQQACPCGTVWGSGPSLASTTGALLLGTERPLCSMCPCHTVPSCVAEFCVVTKAGTVTLSDVVLNLHSEHTRVHASEARSRSGEGGKVPMPHSESLTPGCDSQGRAM